MSSMAHTLLHHVSTGLLRFRRELILLVFLVLLVVGQMLPPLSVVVQILLFIIVIFPGIRIASLLTFPLLLGNISGYSFIPSTPLSSGTYTVIVEKAGLSRYPMRGLHQLRLRIVSVQHKETFIHLEAPHYSLCRAIHLPWRNLTSLQKSELRVLRIKLSTLDSRYMSRYGGRVDSFCKILGAASDEKTIASRNNLQRTEGEGILLAVAFGASDQISLRTERDLKRLGIYHLLVLSGLHLNLLTAGARQMVSLTGYFMQSLRRLHKVGKIVHEIIVLSPAVILTHVLDYPASCTRAMIWLLVGSIVTVCGRKIHFLSQLFVTLILLFLFFPGIYAERGLWITISALFGIYHGSLIAKGGVVLRALITSLMVTFYAQLVVLALFGQVSLAGFITGPLLTSCFIAAFLWIVWIAAVLAYYKVENGMVMTFLSRLASHLRDVLHGLSNALPEPLQLEKTEIFFVILGLTICLGVDCARRAFDLDRSFFLRLFLRKTQFTSKNIS
jgi:hypothetical protein